MAEGESVSKSAKRRANKKAREAAEAAAEAEAQPPTSQAPAATTTPAAKAAVAKAPASKAPSATAPATKAPAAKAAAAAKAPGAKAAADDKAPPANAKASTAAPAKATATAGKATPSSKTPAVATAATPAAEPKAKGKSKAKAAAVPVEVEAVPTAPPQGKAEPVQKAGAKAKAEGKAKAASKKKAEPQPQEVDTSKKDPPTSFYEIDDGSGGDWELMTGMTKKQQRRKEKQEQEAAAAVDAKASAPEKGGQKVAPAAEAPAVAQKVETKAKAAAKAKATAEEPPRAPTNEAAETTAAVAIAAPTSPPKEEEQPKEPPPASVTITVPSEKIRIVIGQKGSKIKMIQEKTGVKGIDTIGELFTVTGTPEAVAEAECAIKELIEKGYTMMSYENGKEDGIMVHPSAFPDIIGKEGSVIRKIKDELNVEVNIPQVPKSNDVNKSSKKYRVALAGNSNDVEKAKAVISDIVMYYHNEITHPEVVHAEMDVPDWALRFLIGRAGSELRHIQNNYKVRVAIPREYSANDKVVIVGEAAAVERAKIYAEKVIESNSQPKRDTVAESDVMGEAGDEEPWMRAYMYKRGTK